MLVSSKNVSKQIAIVINFKSLLDVLASFVPHRPILAPVSLSNNMYYRRILLVFVDNTFQ